MSNVLGHRRTLSATNPLLQNPIVFFKLLDPLDKGCVELDNMKHLLLELPKGIRPTINGF